VAIVDAYDDPNVESDLATYRSRYGIPPCTTGDGCFRKVNQSGGTSYPSPNAGWAVEISLDVEMVSAACPNCHVLLVEASTNSDSNLFAAENEAAALGATEISNSWGGEEFSGETSDDAYFHHPGVPIMASAGDFGYGVEYPAASQYVTAVGGTSLSRASNSRGWSETAWSGTGSGCSAYEPKPAWQTDPGCANRTNTDVAAVADPETPVSIADSYKLPSEFPRPEAGWTLVGGTSVASPLIAGTMALANLYTKSFDGARAFYTEAAQNGTGALDDVVSGSNGRCGNYLCNAGVGYDGPTGLGSPYGAPVALPEWYENGVRSKEPQRVETISWGTLTLKTVAGGSGEVTCHTAQAGTVWNPEHGGAGKGETQVFATYDCEQIGMCPEGTRVGVAGEALPWPSTLEASGSAIRVRTERVKVNIACFAGETPVGGVKLVGASAPSSQKGSSASHPSFLQFDQESGALEEEGSGGTVLDRIEGDVKSLGYNNQELVTAK
jgi:hypothetical protein